LQLSNHIIRKTICRADPDPSDDRFLDPGLVLFSEKADVDQIVDNLARSGIAVNVSIISSL
jgi:hypothetical protein